MPGFTTHYIMGMKAFNDLPPSYLKHIIAKYRWLYQLGLQGPDMFFYNIPVLRHRDYRNVGSYMHEAHVNDFFRCYLTELSQVTSKQQREEGLAYFCGFICHYVGDSICHPFIYARIHYNPEKPDHRCHGLHASLENDLDAILLYKYKKKKPSEFNQAATICLNGQETQFISRFLCKCINEAYYPLSETNSYQVTARMVHRSILALRFGCRTLSDPSGIKSSSIGFVEGLLLRHPVASQKLVTDNIKDIQNSLNQNHELWHNPWDPSYASSESFTELFHRTLQKCSNVYLLLNRSLASGALFETPDFAEILSELGNLSYHSGLDVDLVPEK
ncbi:MAG: zinc dependent phospholipase C family protein [bacterium]|nr:zinc dependent phospholipase C family protein [bacterium]